MADRTQKGLIPLQAALVFLRGPTPVQRPAPQLVGAPNKGREAGQDGQLGQAQGVRPEDRLEGRQVDDGGREDKFEEYSPEEQSVGEEGDLLHQVSLYETVLRVEQCAAEEAHPGGTPARLPRELLDVAFCFL